MSKSVKKKKEKKPKSPENNQSDLTSTRTPWISMKTGLRAITVVSILMAGFVAYQVIPSKGWVQGILYGLLFGAMIWIVFLIMQIFFRLIK
jgi:putative membrane protein (TIGR04086 family)